MAYQDHVVSPGDVSANVNGVVYVHVATNPHVYILFDSIYVDDPICFKNMTTGVVVWKVHCDWQYIKYKLSQAGEKRYSLRRRHAVHIGCS